MDMEKAKEAVRDISYNNTYILLDAFDTPEGRLPKGKVP